MKKLDVDGMVLSSKNMLSAKKFMINKLVESLIEFTPSKEGETPEMIMSSILYSIKCILNDECKLIAQEMINDFLKAVKK